MAGSAGTSGTGPSVDVEPMSGPLTDILEVLAGLEADGAAGWNADFLAGPGIAADPALPGLDLEYAKSAQLDAVPALHRQPHGVEYGVHRHLCLDLGDVGDLGNLVDDIDLDHG